jgi:hypothetical protein
MRPGRAPASASASRRSIFKRRHSTNALASSWLRCRTICRQGIAATACASGSYPWPEVLTCHQCLSPSCRRSACPERRPGSASTSLLIIPTASAADVLHALLIPSWPSSGLTRGSTRPSPCARLLIGIASFAKPMFAEMAGSGPTGTRLESQSFRWLALFETSLRPLRAMTRPRTVAGLPNCRRKRCNCHQPTISLVACLRYLGADQGPTSAKGSNG